MTEHLTGFREANLADMLDALGEERVNGLLSEFSCPLNPDVEYFLQHRAIVFCRQGISATHLVFTSYQGKPVLVGYYALANKTVVIKTHDLSARMRQRLRWFATPMQEMRQYYLALPLIGQLGKNFANGYHRLITGDQLLQMACDRVRDMQRAFGGKAVYLECEDIPALTEFYERNQFVRFAQRELDRDEQGLMKSAYLVQMLRYF